ncbi:MAG TPA: molybdenum cofactor guanylyltransferase [Candidatus Polarisedimenticolaceae bacterium]|nr:molybdenum cofactor guanylyltransferase [Candidatus Polarisedimenticolaceae bacterium]
MAQLIGLVLAGGEGRRFGEPKGSVKLGGSTLAERAARALKPLCGSVIVSVAKGGKNPAPAHPAIEDAGERSGPLGGIAAVFASTGRADLLVLACDYPAVGTSLLRSLIAASDGSDDLVFPVDAAGRDHPLVGLWRRSAESVVIAALAEGQRKVQAILPDLSVRRLPAQVFPNFDLARVLANVNWPGDLRTFTDA